MWPLSSQTCVDLAVLDADLVGDVAWTALSTEDGDETIDGQDVRVNQVRIGADLALAARLGRAALAPFAKVYVRRDGGAGQTGAGVEVSGGLWAALGIVRLDAQARILALHSAEGYGERGAALTLTVGARGSKGLSLSVSPRWGDPALGAGALWEGPLGHGVRPQGPLSDRLTLDAQARYTVCLPGGIQLNLFGGHGDKAAGSRFGVRLGVAGKRPG